MTAESDQDKLEVLVTDPKTIAKAVEGSMAKRRAVLDAEPALEPPNSGKLNVADSQPSQPTPASSPDEAGDELEKLKTLIGDICHESYTGCTKTNRTEKEWDYSYTDEVINLLEDARIKQAITRLIERGRLRAQIDLVKSLPLKFDTEVSGTGYKIYGYSRKTRASAVADLQSQLAKLEKEQGDGQ